MNRNNGHQAERQAPVQLDEGMVRITDLTLVSRPVYEFLERLPVEERVESFTRATELGVLCLERAGAYRDVDFVRQQLEQQVKLVAGEVEKIPAAIAQELAKKLGTDEGQVLAPIQAAVTGTEKLIKERIGAVQTLLDKEIDPRRPDTTLGKTLLIIGRLLDPKRDGSVQKNVEKALSEIAAEDGTLAELVSKTVNASVKPLLDAVDRLRKDVQKQDTEAETLAKTIAKGTKFEDQLCGTLQLWAKFNGAALEAVGKDRRPGDFVLGLNDPTSGEIQHRIVIEARDDAGACGRKRISDDLSDSMKARDAHYGIYVSRNPAGLAREIGDWAEGRCRQGAWVACVGTHLLLAVRFAVIDLRQRSLAVAHPELDAAEIEKQIGHVRASLRRLRTIRNRSGDIRKNADLINEESEELRREITEALNLVESALRCAPALPARKRARSA